MSNELMPIGSNSSKSWFSRPEGKVGAAIPVVLGGAAIGALIYGWGTVLPWLITMMQDTLHLAALCGIAALGFVLVSDKRLRTLAVYAYKSAIRGLTSLFIEIDPIGILKSYVESLQKKLEEMDESISNLSGQIRKLQNQIQKNEQERQHAMGMAQEAHRKGDAMRTVFILQSRQAGRLEESNKKLQNLLDRMNILMTMLRKMREASSVMVEDIKGQVEVSTQERNSMLAGYGALTRARRILQGGGDEAAIFNMTMEKLADDYGMKMGEIEDFMETSKGLMQSIDLENDLYVDKALKQFDLLEQKTNNLLVSHEEAQQQTVTTSSNDYADIFARTDKK